MSERTFRTAKVFDGTGMDGRPHVDRQMLDETEAGRVLAYLESAPVVHAAEGFGLDRIDPARGRAVPLTWHTDGGWVWPGSVTYYLRSYALPPDNDFLAHIREHRFQPPAVSPDAKQAAVAAVSGESGAPTAASTPTAASASAPAANPVTPAAATPAAGSTPTPVSTGHGGSTGYGSSTGSATGYGGSTGSATGYGSSTGYGGATGSSGATGSTASIGTDPGDVRDDDPAGASSATPYPPLGAGSTSPYPSGPARESVYAAPTAEPPMSTDAPGAAPGATPSAASTATGGGSTAPAVDDDSASFDSLRGAASEFGVSRRAYRIGAGVEGAWSVLREGSQWSVFRTEHGGRHEHVAFATSQQATAYLIGQLYLSRPPAPAEEPAEEPADESAGGASRSVATVGSEAPATDARAADADRRTPSAAEIAAASMTPNPATAGLGLAGMGVGAGLAAAAMTPGPHDEPEPGAAASDAPATAEHGDADIADLDPTDETVDAVAGDTATDADGDGRPTADEPTATSTDAIGETGDTTDETDAHADEDARSDDVARGSESDDPHGSPATADATDTDDAQADRTTVVPATDAAGHTPSPDGSDGPDQLTAFDGSDEADGSDAVATQADDRVTGDEPSADEPAPVDARAADEQPGVTTTAAPDPADPADLADTDAAGADAERPASEHDLDRARGERDADGTPSTIGEGLTAGQAARAAVSAGPVEQSTAQFTPVFDDDTDDVTDAAGPLTSGRADERPAAEHAVGDSGSSGSAAGPDDPTADTGPRPGGIGAGTPATNMGTGTAGLAAGAAGAAAGAAAGVGAAFGAARPGMPGAGGPGSSGPGSSGPGVTGPGATGPERSTPEARPPYGRDVAGPGASGPGGRGPDGLGRPAGPGAPDRGAPHGDEIVRDRPADGRPGAGRPGGGPEQGGFARRPGAPFDQETPGGQPHRPGSQPPGRPGLDRQPGPQGPNQQGPGRQGPGQSGPNQQGPGQQGPSQQGPSRPGQHPHGPGRPGQPGSPQPGQRPAGQQPPGQQRLGEPAAGSEQHAPPRPGQPPAAGDRAGANGKGAPEADARANGNGESASANGGFQPSAPQWRIQPLPGEPPLTLYRDKRIVTLPAGTEIDRYGESNGNVAYAARTQYEQRSLPADWSNHAYHAYRTQRPIEALTGLAVPWFEQPGGGTAFVLPRSIADLVADGTLAEIDEPTANR